MLDAYHTSFRNLVLRMKERRQVIPLWLPTLVDRIPVRLSSVYPVEVVCLCELMVERDHSMDRDVLAAKLLLQRGWSVETSLKMYKNFLFLHPQLRFTLESHKVLNRAALREEYGPTFGDLMADIAMDPDSQPIIHALLSGDLQTLRHRPMMEAAMRFAFDPYLLHPSSPTIPGGMQLDFELWYRSGPGAVFDKTSKPYTLSHADASEIYFKATGLHPNFTFDINPMELDYDGLAESAQPIR